MVGRTFSPASFPANFIRCGIAPCIRYLAYRASESCFILTGYLPGMRLRSAVLFKSYESPLKHLVEHIRIGSGMALSREKGV